MVGDLASPRQPMSAPFSRSLQTASNLCVSEHPTAFAQDLSLVADTGDVPCKLLFSGNFSQNVSSAEAR